jgi:HK97 family phage major capsid protein
LSILDDLRARRQNTYLELRALADTASNENRAFDGGEQSTYERLMASLDSFDARIKELAEQEQRGRQADDAFARLAGGGGVPGRVPFSKADEEIGRAFMSAVKSKNPAPIEVGAAELRGPFQPGLEYRDLLKSTATQAMPVSVYDRILMHMVENSAVMAAGATTVVTSTGEDLQVPKDTAYNTAALTTEGSPITESDATLAVSTLKAYKFAAFFQVSTELATDTPTDLLSFLARQAGEALALAYGPYLITGTGSSQPQGVVTAATVGKTGPTGTTVSLGTQSTAGQGTDILYDLIGSLAEPYSRQPSTGFVLTNASLAIARKLKDSAGQPVAGMVGGGLNAAVSGAPSGNNVILGYPAFVDPNVAAMAANAKSIIFGDFSRYFVRIVNGIRFERSDDFAFQNDLVSFRAIIRLDGALVDANGIKLFANSAT